MRDRLVGLEFLYPFLVSLDVFSVDLVLGSRWVEAAELEQNLDGTLVFCRGESFGAFSLELDRVFRVLDS
jgi:hypothetical protein